MSIVNSVRLIGNLGGQVDLAYTQGGQAVAKFSLATTEKWKDRDGNRKEDTSWHRIVIFGALAEIAGQYLGKGSKVAVSGRIKYGKYDKDGVTHYTSDILVDELHMLGGGQDADDQREEHGGGRQQRGGHGGSRGGAPQRHRPAPATQPPMDDFQDDSIPFLHW